MCAFTQRAREAGMAQSDFGRALAGAERRMERAAVELARTRRPDWKREDMAGAFGVLPFGLLRGGGEVGTARTGASGLYRCTRRQRN